MPPLWQALRSLNSPNKKIYKFQGILDSMAKEIKELRALLGLDSRSVILMKYFGDDKPDFLSFDNYGKCRIHVLENYRGSKIKFSSTGLMDNESKGLREIIDAVEENNK